MTGPSFDRRTLLRVAGSTASAVAVLGTPRVGGASASSSEWPMYQLDAGNSGFAPAVDAPDDPFERWRLQSASNPRTTPVLHEGRVIVGTNDVVDCRDATTGELVWSVDAGCDSLAVANGVLACRTNEGDVVGLNPDDGSEEWRSSQQTSFTGDLTVVGDTVVLPVRSRLVALDAASGDTRWTYTVTSSSGREAIPQATPAVQDGTAFVDADDQVHAVSVADGTEQWRAAPSDGVGESLAVADGTLVVGGSAVTAFDAGSGDRKWSVPFAGPEAAVAVADGTVFASNTSVTKAISGSDGSVSWQTDIADDDIVSRYPTPPVVDANYVYVNTRNKLFALDRSSGDTAWEFTSEYTKELAAPPALSDGGIYLSAGGGVMQVLRANAEPEVAFTVTPESPVVGEEVTFDASETTDPDPPVEYFEGSADSTVRDGYALTFEWDFTGDGTADATGPKPTYTYEEPGTYAVTLTVSGGSASPVTATTDVTVTAETTTTTETTTESSTTEPDAGSDQSTTASQSALSDATTDGVETAESTPESSGGVPLGWWVPGVGVVGGLLAEYLTSGGDDGQ